MTTHSPRRAVGIVRVSQVGGREGDRFVSPAQQRERIVNACEANGLQLVTVHEELDVSAGNAIARRPGLRQALAAVEARSADTVVVAYFDRLFRNLQVQAEVVERIERAGGSILAVDVGEVRADTATSWLSSTLLGAVADYHRRMTKERTNLSRRGAIERGIPATGRILPGYRKGADRRLEVDEAAAAIVRGAFQLRADGGSWGEVRRYLHEHGISRTLSGTKSIIESRTVLGELSHGEHVNVNAHAAIVDRELFDRAQRAKGAPVGPRSDALLAQLGGVLKCGTCGGSLSSGTLQRAGGLKYHVYRCQGNSTFCARRASMAGPILERIVTERVHELLAGQSATASASVELGEARDQLRERETALDQAIEVLADLGDVAAAKRKLGDLRDQVAAARTRVDELQRAASVTVTVNAAADWDLLTLAERRALIGAVIRRVVVLPGQRGVTGGAERVRIEAAIE